jgi:hypothetical protein
MKKILFLMLLAGAAYGQMAQIRDFSLGTNGVGSVTFNDVRGEIHAVHVLGVTTGNFVVAYSPIGGLTPVSISTNVVALQKLFRPVATSTDVAGAAIAHYKPYVLAGEDVTVSVTAGAASAAWRCILIVK